MTAATARCVTGHPVATVFVVHEPDPDGPGLRETGVQVLMHADRVTDALQCRECGREACVMWVRCPPGLPATTRGEGTAANYALNGSPRFGARDRVGSAETPERGAVEKSPPSRPRGYPPVRLDEEPANANTDASAAVRPGGAAKIW